MDIVLLTILICLQIGGAVTTYLALLNPENREANPLVASVIEVIGLVPGLLVVKGLTVAALLWAAPYLTSLFFTPLVALYAWVIANNTGVIRK